jgi:hypothetical protein
MDLQKTSSRLDNIGMTASTLCAIHCAVVPVLFTSLPLLGLGFLANAWLEWGMIVLTLIIGAYSIGMSYLRIHRKPQPLFLLTAGFAIIVLGHLFATGWTDMVVVPAGGLFIAAAHFVNYKFTGACRHNGKALQLKKVAE